jgi:hypothetical protein
VPELFGKNVPVRYTGLEAGHLRQYALTEVDTLELKNIKVNTDAFVGADSLKNGMSCSGVDFI